MRGRDARTVHASLRFFCLVAGCVLSLLTTSAGAQTSRPWLDWRSLETEHFVLHYPAPYSVWSSALALRIEGIRSQVTAVVGFAPPGKVHVVIDDPFNQSNGQALTPLDAPTVVLWVTPPSPREEIGNFRVWPELLATHEFAHVAHLVRPSRNKLQRLLWSLSPVPLGPIPSNAPRWALEGYATYVEGKVTGSGRPNHAWRAAVLRQFALEGRLPSYGALNASGGFETGSFAYLAGSAFIEWLARRQGDSSVTAIWRRMTARTPRSFDAAFAGVYGGPPPELYGRFAAELTADALALERALAKDALVPGTLVQRLIRGTGDPAVSPDGRFVALTVRHTESPSELVVWKTADEPDTLSSRRDAASLERDPEDVPDRRFYPAPKQAVISLVAIDGAPYESPRWLPDNKHLLVTRLMPSEDGTVRPDLFRWSAEDGTLERITWSGAIRDADPSADGRWAAAVRCDRGWCDLVRVDLELGTIRVLRPGGLERNYHRPRVSKVTGEIAVAEQFGDRWRIARVSPDTGALAYADPDDGATRYDASFEADGRTLVATSEAGGIANLERLGINGRATPLTSVTGAAVGVDVAPDGALWFLSLQSNGYDLERLVADSASIIRARLGAVRARIALSDSLSPVLPPRTLAAARLPAGSASGLVSPARAYGIGPTRLRYLPSLTTVYVGTSVQLSLIRSDPVGRLGISITGAAGAGARPAGVAATVTTRRRLVVVSGHAWLSHEAPAYIVSDQFDRSLDARREGGALRLERTRVGDSGELVATLAGLMERQVPSVRDAQTRVASLASASFTASQRDEDSRYFEQVNGFVEIGHTNDGAYVRRRASAYFGTSTGGASLFDLRAAYGSVHGDGSKRERFAIGGFGSPLLDTLFDARRVELPAYPVGSANAASFTAWRAGLPVLFGEIYYSGASPDLYKSTLRSYGAEIRTHVAAVAALGTPEVRVMTGFARAVDAPVKGEWRYYVTFALRP